MGFAASPPSLFSLLLIAAGSVLFYWWLKCYADRLSARQKPVDTESFAKKHPEMIRHWEPLFQSARAVMRETIASLPAEIRREADRVPWTLQKWSQHGELGLFSGYLDDRLSEGGTIQIFLGDIYLYCDQDIESFEEEVRITYLHELGHHLGWDEDDLEARGLG